MDGGKNSMFKLISIVTEQINTETIIVDCIDCSEIDVSGCIRDALEMSESDHTLYTYKKDNKCIAIEYLKKTGQGQIKEESFVYSAKTLQILRYDLELKNQPKRML